MSICAGIITRSHIHIETALGLLYATQYTKTEVAGEEPVVVPPSLGYVLPHAHGPYLDDARNTLIETYLRDLAFEHEWLLFIDSDINFKPSDPTRLLAPILDNPLADAIDTPVIGGVYVNPINPQCELRPVVYEWREELVPGVKGRDRDEVWHFSQLTREELDERQSYAPLVADEVCEVDAIGAGFLAIHRSLLETLLTEFGFPCPWFAEPEINGIHVGEDLGFCARVKHLGYPVLAHRGVRLAHHKEVRLI